SASPESRHRRKRSGIFFGDPGPQPWLWITFHASRKLELGELAVLGADPAHGAGGRAHHDRVGLDQALAEAHALEHRARGDAGRREHAIALHHLLDRVLLARIADPHLVGARALLLGVEDEASLHLAADAGERRRGEHAFRRTTDTEIDVDAGGLSV